MLKKSNNKIWSLFGKFAFIVSIILGSLQIKSLLTEPHEYKLEVKGNYHFYNFPKELENQLEDYKNILHMEQAYKESISEQDASLSNIKKFLAEGRKNEDLWDRFIKIKYDGTYRVFNFSRLWHYVIRNKGLKTLKNLVLEMPSGCDGYYTIKPQYDTELSGNFKRYIELGDLNTAHEIHVYCWMDKYPRPDNIMNETIITHSNGWVKIKYQTGIDEFLIWSTKKSGWPIILLIIPILILMSLSFYIGVKYAFISLKKTVK
jgi:hypothetical protein